MHLASKSNEIEETHISITLQIPKTLILGIKFLILIFFFVGVLVISNQTVVLGKCQENVNGLSGNYNI